MQGKSANTPTETSQSTTSGQERGSTSRDSGSDTSNTTNESQGTGADIQLQVNLKTHPDGGWGWVVCLGAFFVQFIALGMQNSAGILYTALVDEFKSSRGDTAWVGSLATSIMFLFGPLTTSMCEAFGCRIVTLCGGITCVAGLVLSSFATSLTVLYVTYGLIFGVGTSLCFFSTLVVLSKYFKNRLALVNGLAAAGSGVGTIVMGPTVQACLQHLGVSNTFLVVAGIFGIIIICGACFRPVKAKSRIVVGQRKLFDWTIFSNKGYLVWTLAMAIFQLGYFVPFVHLVRHAEDLGVSPTNASLLISYLSLASTAGRLFFGRVADLKCIDRLHTHQAGLFVMGLCSFLVPMATGYGGLVAYVVTFGFFEADFVVLIPLVTLDIVGAASMSYAIGSTFTVMAFPLLVGPPLAGWLYDMAGDYSVAFYACGTAAVIPAILMFIIPWLRPSPLAGDSPQSIRSAEVDVERGPPTQGMSHDELLHTYFGCICARKSKRPTQENSNYDVLLSAENPGKTNS